LCALAPLSVEQRTCADIVELKLLTKSDVKRSAPHRII
jgi:hypothetical protein